MAIYFKYPNCNTYHEDYSGEYAAGDYSDVENYRCPNCHSVMKQVDYEEFRENRF